MAAWVIANLAIAVVVPVLFAWWLRGQVPAEDLVPGEAQKITSAIRAFAAAWLVFLILANVTVGVFLWLRRSSRTDHSRSSVR